MRTTSAPQPIQVEFIVPAEIEKAWRLGDRDALRDWVLQMAKDTASYCARRYEKHLDHAN